MERQIKGINVKLAQHLCELIPTVGTIEHYIGADLCTLVLDEDVIIKIYEDCIVLDCGTVKEFITPDDFKSLEVS